jgi:Raf kinase inhibitor-like YbhB/YbcL family protein
MKLRFISSVCATALLSSAVGFAQAPPPEVENGLANSALVTLPAKGGAKLTVTSPAFKQMGDIPMANTQYQTNTFPGLEWTAGPAGTQTYAIIMQDTDGAAGRGGGIFLHWTAFNIKATKLDAGMTALPSGTHGPGMGGAGRGYMGPRTPAGPKHRYHFQVFALDTTLPAEAGATIESLTAAIKDHVLASGEIVGLGQVDPNAPARGGRGGGAPGGRGGGAPGGGPGGGAPGGRGGGAPGGGAPGGAPRGPGGAAPGGAPGGGR